MKNPIKDGVVGHKCVADAEEMRVAEVAGFGAPARRNEFVVPSGLGDVEVICLDDIWLITRERVYGHAFGSVAPDSQMR